MNTIERADVQSVLAQMRTMREAAQGAMLESMHTPDQATTSQPIQKSDFGTTLRTAIDQVNSTQLQSSALTNSFIRGETDDLVKVMITAQKSNVAFQAITQVRNRLVTAYQDIMNMPI